MNNTPVPVSAPVNLVNLSREPTLEIIEGPPSLPSHKRQSIDNPEGAQPSALKRLKEASVNKENVFSASSSSSKGKHRAVHRQWSPNVSPEVNTPFHDISSRPDPCLASLSSNTSYVDP